MKKAIIYKCGYYSKIFLIFSLDDAFGKISISNEDGNVYFYYYGFESGNDDKFAGWDTLDNNDYISMFKFYFDGQVF